jgi:hypothetical protein
MSQTVPQRTAGVGSPLRGLSEKCARIKNLGFSTSKHIKMYGERFEIVSDPFNECDCIAVHAISEGDPQHHPTMRTLLLPIAILVGKSVHN